MEQRLVTTEEVAAALNCSRTTIWRKVKSGELPAPMKVCGLTRWRSGDIDSLINGSNPAPGTKIKPRNRVRAAA